MSTRWCFTLNNYTKSDMELLSKMDCNYLIYGEEVAPMTGTPHLQGYVVFKTTKRLTGVTKLLTAHWSMAKGTTEQNVAYCTKDGNYVEYGTRPMTPKEKGLKEKERWARIIELAKTGLLEKEDPKMYYTHLNTNLRLQSMYQKPIGIKKNVYVFWGETGTGKSYDAWKLAGSDAYPKDPRSKWWNGYNGQKNVIIDEFRGGIDIAHMLRWLDEYPVSVEIKGSTTPLCAENIWITSNLHPTNWYPDLDEETKHALLRRIKVTRYWGVLGKYVTKTKE